MGRTDIRFSPTEKMFIMDRVTEENNIGKSAVHDIIKSELKLWSFMAKIKGGEYIRERETMRRDD